MLIAQDTPEPRLPWPPMTPQERGLVARAIADETLPDPLPCRCCVLQVLSQVVQLAVEDAERDLRREQVEDDSCRN